MLHQKSLPCTAAIRTRALLGSYNYFHSSKARSFKKRTLQVICLFFLLIIPAVSFSGPSSQKKSTSERYLSKDYVDTSIQRAFYVLNEAASTAGIGFKQKQAIDQAKSIARMLRQKAKGDRNERYYLWKISELEAQIYLEERDILLMQMHQGQESVNKLVAKYNAEVGKERPDFALMRRIHVQMNKLDISKGNQLASSYNKRYRSISQQVRVALENAITSGNLEKAQQELGYCLRNAAYLSISSSTISKFENRIEKLSRAQTEQPHIEEETKIALDALKRNDLSTARENLSRATNRFTEIRNYLPRTTLSALQSNLNKGNKLLPFKEDSLVSLNLSILSKEGVSAADDFLQHVLRSHGVSIEKVALVDKAIIGVKMPEDTKMSDEINSLSTETASDENQPSVLDNIMARAKQMAQEKADSIRRINEEANRIAMIEQQRQDSIAAVRRAIEMAEYQKKQNQAQTISMDIYSYLEKNRTSSAMRQFNRQRAFLLEYLDKESFYILETTLHQFAAPPPQAEPVQVASSGTNSQTIIPVEEQIKSSEPLPQAIEDKLQKNQQRAEQEITEIYAMLEKNQISDAYARFQEIRKPLQMFLQREIYTMLETTLSQAWEFQKSFENEK